MRHFCQFFRDNFRPEITCYIAFGVNLDQTSICQDVSIKFCDSTYRYFLRYTSRSLCDGRTTAFCLKNTTACDARWPNALNTRLPIKGDNGVKGSNPTGATRRPTKPETVAPLIMGMNCCLMALQQLTVIIAWIL